MTHKRVVITGLGMVTPLGLDVSSSWRAVLEGRSGIAPITGVDASAFPTHFGGEIKGFDIAAYMSPKDARRLDGFIQYGLAACVQAMQDSGLEVTPENTERIGVSMGSGIGGLGNIENTCALLFDQGPRKISPFFVPGSIINMISGVVSIQLGLQGPNFALATACTTGTHSLGMAARSILCGEADVMLAGGAEKALCRLGLGAFGAARALSVRNDEPELASRPWDRARDGFVLSDGAGAVVLEELEHARARGARIYAELIGFGMSADAFHMTAPADSGTGAAQCMRNTLRNAGLDPQAVDYINAHGTSTVAGDLAEMSAVKQIFGAHAQKLCMSSTKSMTGHLLGAAGAVEAIFSVLALYEQIVPPTINLDDPDEGCDLDLVPHKASERDLNVVISNSFGFGGTNGTLAFRRYCA